MTASLHVSPNNNTPHGWQHCSPPPCLPLQECPHHHWYGNWQGTQILPTTMPPKIQTRLEPLCCQQIWLPCPRGRKSLKRHQHHQVTNPKFPMTIGRTSCIFISFALYAWRKMTTTPAKQLCAEISSVTQKTLKPTQPCYSLSKYSSTVPFLR